MKASERLFTEAELFQLKATMAAAMLAGKETKPPSHVDKQVFAEHAIESVDSIINVLDICGNDTPNALVRTNDDEDSSDWELTAHSVWIKVGDVALYIRNEGDRVIVEACKNGAEMETLDTMEVKL